MQGEGPWFGDKPAVGSASFNHKWRAELSSGQLPSVLQRPHADGMPSNASNGPAWQPLPPEPALPVLADWEGPVVGRGLSSTSNRSYKSGSNAKLVNRSNNTAVAVGGCMSEQALLTGVTGTYEELHPRVESLQQHHAVRTARGSDDVPAGTPSGDRELPRKKRRNNSRATVAEHLQQQHQPQLQQPQLQPQQPGTEQVRHAFSPAFGQPGPPLQQPASSWPQTQPAWQLASGGSRTTDRPPSSTQAQLSALAARAAQQVQAEERGTWMEDRPREEMVNILADLLGAQ